jgi:hypothetical protein
LRDGPLYGTLIEMIKETIPELQKLSTADKFALAVELWEFLGCLAEGGERFGVKVYRQPASNVGPQPLV